MITIERDARRARTSPHAWRWIAIALATSCGGTITTADLTTPDVADVVIAPLTSSVIVGGTLPLHATVRDASGQSITGPTVVWSVRDTSIATVSTVGVVSARAVGSTQVAASANGKSGIASVAVMPVPAIASVVIQPRSASLQRGATLQLSAAIADETGAVITDRVPTWTSSDASIALVSASGLVMAVAPGAANIAATLDDKADTVSITVVPVPVGSVVVEPSTATLAVGQSTTLTATVKDANGAVVTDRAVAWTSSNALVASVTEAGVVKALTAGAASISATSEGFTGSAMITVSPAPVAGISLQPTSVTLQRNMTATLTATLTDASGTVLTGRSIAWKSSDTTIARVSGSGVVTAVQLGAATITATSEGKSANASITVATGPVDRILISPTSIGNLRDGHSVLLTATAVDMNGDVISDAPFTWRSESTFIATVSSTGVVTGEHSGTTTISATFSGKAGSASVRVK